MVMANKSQKELAKATNYSHNSDQNSEEKNKMHQTRVLSEPTSKHSNRDIDVATENIEQVFS